MTTLSRLFLFFFVLIAASFSSQSFAQSCSTQTYTIDNCNSWAAQLSGRYCSIVTIPVVGNPNETREVALRCQNSSSSSSSVASSERPLECAKHLNYDVHGNCVCPNPGTNANDGDRCVSTCPFGYDQNGMCYAEGCPFGDGPASACDDRTCSNEGYKAEELLPGTWICFKEIPDSGSSSSAGGSSSPGNGGGDGDGGSNSSSNSGGMDGSSSSSSSMINPICPSPGWAWSGNTCFKLPKEDGSDPDPDPPGGPNCGAHSWWNGSQCMPNGTGSSSSTGSGGSDVVIPGSSSSAAGGGGGGGAGKGDGFCKSEDDDKPDRDCEGVYTGDGHALDIEQRYEDAKEKFQTVYDELSLDIRDKLSLSVPLGRPDLNCSTEKLFGVTVEVGACARRDFWDLIRNIFYFVCVVLSMYIILQRD